MFSTQVDIDTFRDNNTIASHIFDNRIASLMKSPVVQAFAPWFVDIYATTKQRRKNPPTQNGVLNYGLDLVWSHTAVPHPSALGRIYLQTTAI